MLNIISIIIGVVAGVLLLPGLIPFFGWVNWIMLPIAIVGLLFGLLSRGNAGRNFNLIIIVIGVVRLWLGGGFF